jgi:hypothetical protein
MRSNDYSQAVATRQVIAPNKIIMPVDNLRAPIREEVMVDPNIVSGVGVTSDLGSIFAPQSLTPNILTFVCTAGVTAATFMLFDAISANEETRGLTVVPPTTTNYGNNDVVKGLFSGNSMMFKGFNFEASNLAAFSETINYGDAVPGNDSLKQIVPSSYSRNTAQNTLLLTFTGNIFITATRGIWITVPDGETVTFNFYFGAWYNAYGKG